MSGKALDIAYDDVFDTAAEAEALPPLAGVYVS
jgi:hypothetical protein